MDKERVAAAAAELQSRQRRRKAFNPRALCHAKQLPYVQAATKRNVVRCSRRAGKTTGTAIKLLRLALSEPYANTYYVTTSLKHSRRLVWPTLGKLNKHFQLGGVTNETEAFMHFPQLPEHPHIYLGGAKDVAQIDRIRGYEGGAKHAIVDEAQSIRTNLLTQLVDDVIEPALFDWNGGLDLIGTPGPIRAGYFYDADVGEMSSAWRQFFWTLQDNPFLFKKSGKQPDEILAEIRERRGWTEDHPTYMREYLGLWVDDQDALVLHYDESRNHFDRLPELNRYVIGVDLGFDDYDAVALLGWGQHSNDVYLVHEQMAAKQGMTELSNMVAPLVQKYRPIAVVADLGGIGKKAAVDWSVEIRRRWGIPLEAAEKARKLEHMALLDDALRMGTMKARKDGPFALDCHLIQWDQDARARGLQKISAAYHSDIGDAVLYAYRKAMAYTEQPAPTPKSVDDQFWHDEESRQGDDWWEEVANKLDVE